MSSTDSAHETSANSASSQGKCSGDDMGKICQDVFITGSGSEFYFQDFFGPVKTFFASNIYFYSIIFVFSDPAQNHNLALCPLMCCLNAHIFTS